MKMNGSEIASLSQEDALKFLCHLFPSSLYLHYFSFIIGHSFFSFLSKLCYVCACAFISDYFYIHILTLRAFQFVIFESIFLYVNTRKFSNFIGFECTV